MPIDMGLGERAYYSPGLVASRECLQPGPMASCNQALAPVGEAGRKEEKAWTSMGWHGHWAG
jgi:hypothetical protein